MKKICLLSIFLFLAGAITFGETEPQEEIDYLLFLPNSSNQFVNQQQAMVQLDNLAKYLNGREIALSQIIIYGYAAVVQNGIDPMVLSKNRSSFVISELQKRGVRQNLFSEPVGLGEVNTWGSNLNEESRGPNRRVRVVLDGKLIVVAPAGEMIEEIIPEPVIEEEIEVIETVPAADTTVAAKREEPSDFKFPWWLLLPLLLIPLIALLSKLRKKSGDRPAKPQRVEPQPTVAAAAAPPPVSERAVAASAPPAAATTTAPVLTSEGLSPIPAGLTAAYVTDRNAYYIEEEIRLRAYEYYQLRGGQHGFMDEDWFKALPEICGKYEAMGYECYREDGCWWAKKITTKRV